MLGINDLLVALIVELQFGLDVLYEIAKISDDLRNQRVMLFGQYCYVDGVIGFLCVKNTEWWSTYWMVNNRVTGKLHLS